MKKEKLETFIRDNKRDFDEFEPPLRVWVSIEKELDKKAVRGVKPGKLVSLNLVLRIAGCVLLVLCASAWFLQFKQSESVDLSNINPVLAKQQVQYASLIEEKRTELKQIENEEPQLYQEFSAEILKMEAGYQRLKQDLPQSPNQEATVKAMIQNLQVQIDLLNQQLKIIEQITEVKKQSKNETQQI